MKNWRQFNDECNRCGSDDIQVLTSSKEDFYAYDGEDVRCNECGLKGSICVNDEDDNGDATAYVTWDDFEK